MDTKILNMLEKLDEYVTLNAKITKIGHSYGIIIPKKIAELLLNNINNKEVEIKIKDPKKAEMKKELLKVLGTESKKLRINAKGGI